jgi:hypothetical protein
MSRYTTVLGVVAATALAGCVAGFSPPEAVPYCSLNLSTGRTVCAATEAGLNAATSRGLSPESTFVLAKLYDQAGRTGPYLEIQASGPCDTNSDIDWGTANVGTTWNDRISSFQGFSNCQIRIYENANFTGATYGAFTATDYVGDAMNDRTTSVRYY